ncbi:unnamed protein product, partial [Ectocarpus sp. 12 AP-2014]
RRALQRIPCGTGPAGHCGLGDELPHPPQYPAAIDPVGTGERWARPESVRQHRSLRIIIRSTWRHWRYQPRGWGCVGGLGWRDAACSNERRNLLEGLPCGGRERVWDEGR